MARAKVTAVPRSEGLDGAWSESLRTALAAISGSGDPAWLKSLRSAAAAEVMRAGLPGNKDEAWKYTPLRALQELEPRIVVDAAQDATRQEESPAVERLPLKTPSYGFRWRSGRTYPLAGGVPEGVSIVSLEEVLQVPGNEWLSRVRPLLEGLPVTGRNRAFAALNTALLKQGWVLHVGAGVDAGTCMIDWVQDDAQAAASALHNVRLLVLLEKGSRLHLIEQFVRDGQNSIGAHALNMVLQGELGEGAHLRHTRVQQSGKIHVLLTRTDIQQAGQSEYIFTGFELGGALVRHETNCRLAGPGARSELNGAFVVDGTRHVDHHLCVDHQAPSCSSEQLFRGVMSDHGHGVYNGKAVIQKGADGSRVRQSSANLLLSDFAEIDTKPELEIYADEVEASHGATVGQLDEQAVFYLRSRGLSDEDARRMLTSAFCRVISGRIPDSALSEAIDAMLDAAMPARSMQAEPPGSEPR